MKSRKDTNWEIKTYGPSFQEFRVRDTYPRVVDGNEIMKMVETVKKRILRKRGELQADTKRVTQPGPPGAKRCGAQGAYSPE